ncbi:MAG: serine hydrolase, partial [bacterium]|nr:serine hydrolase [bacterium]
MGKIWIVLLVALLLLPAACKRNDGDDSETYTYQQPEQLEDGWQTSVLSAEGLDGTLITQMMNRTLDGTYLSTHSTVIVKNGRLVLEEYSSLSRRSELHEFQSCTKTVTAILVGIAIEKGFIRDVEERVFDFFPEYAQHNTAEKNEIRVEHLLTMTHGLDWDERTYDYSDSRNDNNGMNASADWIEYFLKKDKVAEPGTTFVYAGGSPMTLAGIINKTSGSQMDVFAQEFLFTPLQIDASHVSWVKQDGLPHAGGGLNMWAREMAKLGQMIVDDGKWKDQQIVPKEWVEEMVTYYIDSDAQGVGYGYLWWLHDFNINGVTISAYHAWGAGGQHLFGVPALDMVVAFTNGHYSLQD